MINIIALPMKPFWETVIIYLTQYIVQFFPIQSGFKFPGLPEGCPDLKSILNKISQGNQNILGVGIVRVKGQEPWIFDPTASIQDMVSKKKGRAVSWSIFPYKPV